MVGGAWWNTRPCSKGLPSACWGLVAAPWALALPGGRCFSLKTNK